MEILSPLRGFFLALAAFVLLSYALDRIEPRQTAVIQQVPIADKNQATRAERSALAQHISKLYRRPASQAHRIVDAAYRVGGQRGVPPTLLLAIVAQESSFNPQARSSYGAQGLMQVVPRFHPEKVQGIAHPEGLNHPESNIEVGALVLKDYWKRSGNLSAALARYSGGANQYAQKVFRHWAQFERVLPRNGTLFAHATQTTGQF
jgi:soluble lytic murein transglycosylase-like protein